MDWHLGINSASDQWWCIEKKFHFEGLAVLAQLLSFTLFGGKCKQGVREAEFEAQIYPKSNGKTYICQQPSPPFEPFSTQDSYQAPLVVSS